MKATLRIGAIVRYNGQLWKLLKRENAGQLRLRRVRNGRADTLFRAYQMVVDRTLVRRA